MTATRILAALCALAILLVRPAAAQPAAPAGATLLAKDTPGSAVGGTFYTRGVRRLAFHVTGVHPGALVRVYLNGNVAAQGRATSTGVVVRTRVRVFAANTFTVTASQEIHGETSEQGSYGTVVIDRTPPAAPGAPILDAADDTGASSADDITSDTKLTFHGVTEPNARVELMVDGALHLKDFAHDTDAADAGGAYAITRLLPPGTHELRTVVMDPAGNISRPGAPLMVTIDGMAPKQPTLVLDPLDNEGSLREWKSERPTPNFIGTGEPGATATLLIDGVVAGTAVVDGAGAFAIMAEPRRDPGTFEITVMQTDISGRRSAATKARTLTILPFQPGGLRGDVNGDGSVDAADVQLLIDRIGLRGVGLPADLNGDGVVDTRDLHELLGIIQAQQGR